MKNIALTIASAILTVSAALGQTGTLTPLFDCWTQGPITDPSSPSNVIVYYGYTYTGTDPLQTYIRNNFFVPFPNRRSQPFVFDPGEHHLVFSVQQPLSEIPMTWFVLDVPLVVDLSLLNGANRCDATRACWDLNQNGVCDLATEDINGDGACTVQDCRGPQGPRGATGATGLQGTQGPAGPAGPKGNAGLAPQLRIVTADSATSIASVSCASTEVLITGGGSCTVPNSTDARLASSIPDGANGWKVACSAGRASAYAVCNLK
jgi:hypothetical protein